MTDTDELAALRAQLKRLERRQAQATGETDRTQRLLLARLLVVIATVAMFLAVSMPWYADVEVQTSDDDEEHLESMSGWGTLSAMAASDEGGFVFGGVYGWFVLIAVFAAGASVFSIERRWVAIVLSTLLGLLAFGLLLVNVQDLDGEKLAGVWCGVFLIAAGAFAWGNLVTALREAERARE
jgi:hypothetical protein